MFPISIVVTPSNSVIAEEEGRYATLLELCSIALATLVSFAIELVRRLKTQIAVNQRNEAALVEAEKLKVLGQMAGNIAHEINNPLTTIELNLKHLSLLADAESLDHLQLTSIAKKTSATVFRISKIIKGLRAISRNDDTEPFEILNIANLVEDCIELSRANAIHADVSVSYTKSPDSSFVLGRSTQLSQVVLNLVSNAIDEVEAVGSGNVTLSVSNRDSTVVIEVLDSGSGIPRAIQHRVLEPFFTTKPAGKGTGLGLSISRQIVDAHKGQIFFTSEPGSTAFRVILPMADLGTRTVEATL